MQPTAWFWIVAAAVLAVALFTVGNAHGQSTGSGAAYQGRPAMSGAQSDLGTMSGPPQGGLAPQSTEDVGGGIGARRQAGMAAPAANGPQVPRDRGLERSQDGPATPRDSGMERLPGSGGELRPQRDRGGDVIKRDRDENGLQQQGKTSQKAKRAGKRSVERARRGVSGVDS
jgi:hypothetical protein